MGKVFIEETSLTAIGDAIREKTGDTALLSPAEMATAIAGISAGGGSGDGVPETISFTDNQLEYTFRNNNWKWILDNYSDRIKTSGITSCRNIFANSNMKEINFTINTSNTTSDCSFYYCFYECQLLERINTPLKYISDLTYMFHGCIRLREIPEMTFRTGGVTGYGAFFACKSLRKVPEKILKSIYTTTTSPYSHPLTNMFQGCYVLDEIRGLNPRSGNINSNLFGNWGFGASSSSRPQRLKEFIFATQDDGTPYTTGWAAQVIDLSNIGVCNYDYLMTDYNSGITADKKVTTAEEYETLKDDPDWFTGDKRFSRYNLQSAINTINSLPDTSKYLATQSDKTNTIKFNYYEGSATDGGMIGDMTEEQIAVATAKGWTVSIIQQ